MLALEYIYWHLNAISVRVFEHEHENTHRAEESTGDQVSTIMAVIVIIGGIDR
jgi:hypothetical protein